MKWIVVKDKYGTCYAANVIKETLKTMKVERGDFNHTATISKNGCDWVSFGSDKDGAMHAASEMNRKRAEIEAKRNADLKRLNDAFFKDRDREV